MAEGTLNSAALLRSAAAGDGAAPAPAHIVPLVTDMAGGGRGIGPRPDPRVLDDAARHDAVNDVLARRPTARVNELTTLAARLLQAPAGQVSLLAEREQVVAASYAADAGQLDRHGQLDQSLCTVTAASGTTLVAPDTRGHPWLAHLPPVTSGTVRAYLGVVLRDEGGHVLGSLCVYDTQPRAWTDEQVTVLGVLGETVAAELSRPIDAEDESDGTLRLQLAVAAADLGSFDHDLRSGTLVWDNRMQALHGYDTTTFPGTLGALHERVHPDDLVRLIDLTAEAVSELGELDVDYRVQLPDGSHRWVVIRGRVLPDMRGGAARMLGTAYERSAEQGVRDELTHLLEAMPAGFVRCDLDWVVTFLNDAAERILDVPKRDLLGGTLWDAFPEARGTTFEAAYAQARDTGNPGMVEAYFAPMDGYFEVHVWPDLTGLSFFFNDISDRTRAQAELEAVSNRLALLADAGARLSASVQPAEVLAVLADLVVPRLASSLVLVVVGEVAELLGQPVSTDGDQLYPVHAAHADPDLQVTLRRLVSELTFSATASSGVGRAVRTGQVQAVHRVPDELIAERAGTPEQAAAIRLLNTGPSLSVPVRSPAGGLGALTVTAAPGKQLDELLLTELGNRAAVALDNALTFARRSREITDLQRSLLPREAAAVPGVQVATRYLPAATGALAGGDFFKTIRVDGRLVAVLGDVMGHGSVSAARAGQLHSVIATLALEGHGPGALLGRLSAGVDTIMDLELATLLVCSYDPVRREVTTATAGHPPPLFAPLTGCPSYLDIEPGPPIGVAVDTYAETTWPLESGSTMVLFSDGLIERRGESITEGLERLRQAVEELRLPPEAVADHILHELGRTRGGDDDVALLVMSHL